MPIISSKELVRFTPERLLGPDAPVFLLKVPTYRDKIAFTTALVEAGLVYPDDVEYVAVLRAAIAECVEDSEQAQLLQFVEEYEAMSDAARQRQAGEVEEQTEAQTELAQKINEITTTLRPHFPPLARLLSQRVNFSQMAPYIRTQMFLVGVEGPRAPILNKNFGRLTDGSIDAVEDRYGAGTIAAIGDRIVELMTPTEDERKNSGSPPALPPDPETSMEGNGLQTAPNGTFSEFVTPVTLN